MDTVRDKIAVVTGAASGIGLGVSRALIGDGCRVAMLDIEGATLEPACADLGGVDAGAHPWCCDVTDRPAVARVAAAVRERFGRVHILCNNAGVHVAGTFAESTYDDWDWVLGVNLQGVVNGMKTYLPMLRAHGEGGHIVNVASIYGVATWERRAVYAASKHAVVALSEVARAELAAEGIGVTAVCPDGVRTRLLSSRRNRPPQLADSGDTTVAHEEAAEKRLAGKGLDPDAVGERIVRAIRADEPYVFTHRSSLERIRERAARMIDAFDGTEAD